MPDVGCRQLRQRIAERTPEVWQRIEEQASEFQRSILRSIWQHSSPYQVRLALQLGSGQTWNNQYTMFPETFNPNYAKASLFFAEHLGVRPGDRVLDPFAGTGIDAFAAILNGASSATAIEQHEPSYVCLQYNIDALGMSETVDVRKGRFQDVLPDLDGLFDLAVANPPFRNASAESPVDEMIRDPGYQDLQDFFRIVPPRLSGVGRIRMVFSDVGDVTYLLDLAEQHKLKADLVAETVWGSDVGIYVFEMTR